MEKEKVWDSQNSGRDEQNPLCFFLLRYIYIHRHIQVFFIPQPFALILVPSHLSSYSYKTSHPQRVSRKRTKKKNENEKKNATSHWWQFERSLRPSSTLFLPIPFAANVASTLESESVEIFSFPSLSPPPRAFLFHLLLHLRSFLWRWRRKPLAQTDDALAHHIFDRGLIFSTERHFFPSINERNTKQTILDSEKQKNYNPLPKVLRAHF